MTTTNIINRKVDIRKVLEKVTSSSTSANHVTLCAELTKSSNRLSPYAFVTELERHRDLAEPVWQFLLVTSHGETDECDPHIKTVVQLLSQSKEWLDVLLDGGEMEQNVKQFDYETRKLVNGFKKSRGVISECVG